MLDTEIESDEMKSERARKTVVSITKMLPSAITISAFCFGLTAIRFALFHKWELAVLCVFVSALLDSFDGRVARILGQSSQFGAELDSLSDLVCFGVAPAMILFLKTVYFMSGFGWGVCMFFAVCCALRLARFNSSLNVPKSDWQKKYFEGIPAPAGALVALFPLILHFATGYEVFLDSWIVVFFMIFSGVFMISTVKNLSSKMIQIKNGIMSPELLVLTLCIICLITELWKTLSLLVAIYICMIPFGAYYYAREKQAFSSKKEASE